MTAREFFEEKTPDGARTFILAVIVAGVLVLLQALYSSLSQPDFGWLQLAVLTVLASCFPVTIPILGGKCQSFTVTIGDVFVFAGLLLFGPQVGVVLAALEGIVSSFRVRVEEPYKFLFNLAQLALAAFVVGTLFYWLEGATPPFYPSQVSSLPRLLAEIGLCALIYFLINSGLISAAMTLLTSESWVQLWNRNFICAVPANFVNGFAAVAVFLMASNDFVITASALYLVFISYYGLAVWLKRRAERELGLGGVGV